MSEKTPLTPAESVEGLMDLARARARAGDAEGAGRTFAAALHLAEHHGLWGPTARAQAWMADADVKRGRLDLARQRLEHAWSLCQEHQLDAATAGTVAGRLGQVLVFSGQPAAGAVWMKQGIRLLNEGEQQREAEELELGLAAICDRVDRAVSEHPTGTLAHVEALILRGHVQAATGRTTGAQADLLAAWESANTTSLPLHRRIAVAIDAARLLATEARHNARAQALLQAARIEAAAETDLLERVDDALASLAHADAS